MNCLARSITMLLLLVVLPLAITHAQELTIEQELAASQKYNFFAIPNQSAAFIRMPARGATRDIDAVFYNPAGATLQEDGFHLSVNNQSLQQNSSLSCNYQYLNNQSGEYDGLVSALFFPSVYGIYKKNKVALWFGATPVAGGGGAEFSDLPTNDRNVADIIPSLTNLFNIANVDSQFLGMENYRLNFRSTGLAFFAGTQIGLSYQINPYVSVGAGVRYVFARNSAEGHTRNIEIYASTLDQWIAPAEYVSYVSENTGPISSLFLDPAVEPLAENTANREIHFVEQGAGFTPMISVDIHHPEDKFTIGLRYEHTTNVELTTEIIDGKDGQAEGTDLPPLFIDGSSVRSDLPGFLGYGVSFRPIKRLNIAVGGRYLFSKNTNLNGREDFIDNNYYEIETGIEYNVTDKFAISAGYTFANWGVNQNYQTDVDFWTDVHTIGFGGNYKLSDKVSFNIGAMYSNFNRQQNTYTHNPVPLPDIGLPPALVDNLQVPPSDYTNTYDKSAFIFAIGADFSFTKKNKQETPATN